MLAGTYLLNIGIFLTVFLGFIEKHRCFTREGGLNYSPHVGLDFTHTFSEKVMCYMHWSFTSWMAMFLVIMVVLFMYLRSQDASPTKISLSFVVLDLVLVFLSSFVVVGDSHDALMGG